MRHFIENCHDETLSNFGFVIVDVINNENQLSKSQLDLLLLQKEIFWIGTLLTQHKGLNRNMIGIVQSELNAKSRNQLSYDNC